MDLQKCKECEYGKILKKYYEDEFKGKKATIIIKTVTVMLLLQIAIINTIILFKK